MLRLPEPKGGCQAEVGAASAMAASAACELFGGTPAQCFAAASNALCGLMALCATPSQAWSKRPVRSATPRRRQRNRIGANRARGHCNLANFDETVEAMRRVGNSLPFELRESALGGLAATPSGMRILRRLHELANQQDVLNARSV